MRGWGALGGCLVLLGCRQPNPEWKGADEGLATSDTADSSTSTTSTTSTTNTSGPGADSTTEPPVTTEGKDCNNDNMCPDDLVCGPMGCQQGGDGEPCDAAKDCQAPTSICGPEDVCQDGSAGDPCADDGDCMTPTAICGPMDTCQAGEAGDPCSSPNHCAGGLMCTDSVCA